MDNSVGGQGRTGIHNPGNFCYVNAFLQCLAHTDPFRTFVLSKASIRLQTKNTDHFMTRNAQSRGVQHCAHYTSTVSVSLCHPFGHHSNVVQQLCFDQTRRLQECDHQVCGDGAVWQVTDGPTIAHKRTAGHPRVHRLLDGLIARMLQASLCRPGNGTLGHSSDKSLLHRPVPQTAPRVHHPWSVPILLGQRNILHRLSLGIHNLKRYANSVILVIFRVNTLIASPSHVWRSPCLTPLDTRLKSRKRILFSVTWPNKWINISKERKSKCESQHIHFILTFSQRIRLALRECSRACQFL